MMTMARHRTEKERRVITLDFVQHRERVSISCIATPAVVIYCCCCLFYFISHEGTSRDTKKLFSLNFVHKWGIYRLEQAQADMGRNCDLAEISTCSYNFSMGSHFSDKLKISSFDVKLCPYQGVN